MFPIFCPIRVTTHDFLNLKDLSVGLTYCGQTILVIVKTLITTSLPQYESSLLYI